MARAELDAYGTSRLRWPLLFQGHHGFGDVVRALPAGDRGGWSTGLPKTNSHVARLCSSCARLRRVLAAQDRDLVAATRLPLEPRRPQPRVSMRKLRFAAKIAEETTNLLSATSIGWPTLLNHTDRQVSQMRKFLGLFTGLTAGFLVVAMVESVASTMYARPAELDFGNREAVRTFVDTLPASAFLMVLAAHLMGVFTAGLTSVLVVGKRWFAGPAFLGFLMLVAGIVNLVLIPHPAWFGILDLMAYLPTAIIGGVVGGRIVTRIRCRRSSPECSATQVA